MWQFMCACSQIAYLDVDKIDDWVQEEVRDLLSKDHQRRLRLRERPDTGVYVEVRRLVAGQL